LVLSQRFLEHLNLSAFTFIIPSFPRQLYIGIALWIIHRRFSKNNGPYYFFAVLIVLGLGVDPQCARYFVGLFYHVWVQWFDLMGIFEGGHHLVAEEIEIGKVLAHILARGPFVKFEAAADHGGLKVLAQFFYPLVVILD
jgi:hypothetical protein